MKNLTCSNSFGPDWFTAKDYSKILYSAYLIFVLPLMISFMRITMRDSFSMLASMLEKK